MTVMIGIFIIFFEDCGDIRTFDGKKMIIDNHHHPIKRILNNKVINTQSTKNVFVIPMIVDYKVKTLLRWRYLLKLRDDGRELVFCVNDGLFVF